MASILSNPNHCSLVHSMSILGGKWKPIILYRLALRSQRFGKLLVLVPNISRKVLASQLKELEQDELITRKSFPETPPRVEYSLTQKGKDVLPILKLLSDWAFEHYADQQFEVCELPVGEIRVERLEEAL